MNKSPNWKRAAGELHRISAKHLGALGDETVDGARSKAPKLTGALRKTIKRRLTGYGMVVRASARQANLLNRGGVQPGGDVEVKGSKPHTRHRKPVKYKQQGFMTTRPDLLLKYGQRIVAELERVLMS
jgi:hypothetical protein